MTTCLSRRMSGNDKIRCDKTHNERLVSLATDSMRCDTTLLTGIDLQSGPTTIYHLVCFENDAIAG